MRRWIGKRGLVLIILFAAFLRFWQLGQNPPSLTWDEVAWGYNAYSLGIDGRDEFGNFLPVQYLESFGDFKPPVYAYLDVIPIKIWGLTEFAVRFPSAFFGALTVLITYFLVKKLFDEKLKTQNSKLKTTTQNLKVESIALLSAFFLAISPWHINLSRAAFEANVATFFLVLGVLLFLHAVSRGVATFPPRRWNYIDTSGIYLTISIISFVFSMYTFNTARIVAPLLILVLVIGFRKQLLTMKRQLLTMIIVGSILVMPLTMFLLTPQAQLRFREVNIFSDLGVIERTNQEIANDGGAFWSRILHNRRLAYGVEYLRHYLDNLNPGFLFIKGDGNPKFSTQDVGQLFLWDLPFLIVGAYLLFRKREGNWWIIPSWLLLSIIPAATARETPHALRTETALPTFQMLTAYGFYQFMQGIRNYELRIRRLVLVTCCLLLAANFAYYLHGYYVHYPREFSGEWQYGYKEAIEHVETIKDDFDQVNVTTLLGRPYIYYLFYTKTHPEEFRKTAKIRKDGYGFIHVDGFDTYRFGDDLGKLDNENKRILYVNVSGRSPQKANIFKTVGLLNSDPVFTIYEIVYVPEEGQENE